MVTGFVVPVVIILASYTLILLRTSKMSQQEFGVKTDKSGLIRCLLRLRSKSLEKSGSTRSRKVNRMIACVIDRVAYVLNKALFR